MNPTSPQNAPVSLWKTLVLTLIVVSQSFAALAMTGCKGPGANVLPDRPKASVPAWPKDLPTCLTTEQQLSAQFLQSVAKPTCSTPEPSTN